MNVIREVEGKKGEFTPHPGRNILATSRRKKGELQHGGISDESGKGKSMKEETKTVRIIHIPNKKFSQARGSTKRGSIGKTATQQHHREEASESKGRKEEEKKKKGF